MNTRTAITQLTRARNLIDKKGWCRGQYTDNRGHHCIYGALHVVDVGGYFKLAALLSDNIPGSRNPPVHIAAWNDAPTRRKRDVIRLFDRTIQKLEATI